MTKFSLAPEASAQERDLINVRVLENTSLKSMHHLVALDEKTQSFRKPGFGTARAHGDLVDRWKTKNFWQQKE